VRECKKCGASYKGLVCQACHPRRKQVSGAKNDLARELATGGRLPTLPGADASCNDSDGQNDGVGLDDRNFSVLNPTGLAATTG